MNTGSCLCGDVQWQIDGELLMASCCHCAMCRKFHGTEYGRYIAVQADDFRWLEGEEKVQVYESSPGGLRPFCPRCGSVVASKSRDGALAFMPVGNMDGELERPLDSHIFATSRAPWDEILDDAPQYEGYPPEYDAEGQPDMDRPAPTPGAVSGSCLCNAVAYEVTEFLPRFGYCHCSRCRRARSAPHSSQVFASLENFRWLRGEDHLSHFDLPGAAFFQTDFCRTCASPMPTTVAEFGAVLIPSGSLDQDPGVRPMAHIYVDSRAPWFEILDDLPQYPGMPPN